MQLFIKLSYISFLFIILSSCEKKNKIDDWDIIKIDKKYGFELNNDSKNILKEIFDESHSLIGHIQIDTIKNPEWLFKSISYLIERNKILTPQRTYGIPLSIALNNKSFDCMNWVLLFLKIAENNKLPIYAIEAPHHIFLIWNDGKRKFYWETIHDVSLPLEHYIKNYNISREEIEKKIYLSQLEFKDVLISYYFTIINYLIDNNVIGTAKKLCDSIIKIKINNAKFLEIYGYCFYTEKNYKESLKYFESAMKYSPNNLGYMNNYALVNYKLGNKYITIYILNKILEIDSMYNFVGGCLNKCMVYEDNKQYSQMLALIEKYLPNFNKETELWNYKATAMFHLKGVDSALFYLDKSFSLDSTYYDTYLIKAKILSKNKRTMDAINILHSAIRNCYEKDEIINELVKIYKYEKKYQAACVDLAKLTCVGTKPK